MTDLFFLSQGAEFRGEATGDIRYIIIKSEDLN